jgi:tripartite-type tricarboxylate transporter receptor subunit TctC
LIGPSGLAADVVQKLQDATRKTMQEPAVLKALSPQGFVAQGTTSEQAAQTLAAEITKSQTLVKAAGVTIE